MKRTMPYPRSQASSLFLVALAVALIASGSVAVACDIDASESRLDRKTFENDKAACEFLAPFASEGYDRLFKEKAFFERKLESDNQDLKRLDEEKAKADTAERKAELERIEQGLSLSRRYNLYMVEMYRDSIFGDQHWKELEEAYLAGKKAFDGGDFAEAAKQWNHSEFGMRKLLKPAKVAGVAMRARASAEVQREAFEKLQRKLGKADRELVQQANANMLTAEEHFERREYQQSAEAYIKAATTFANLIPAN